MPRTKTWPEPCERVCFSTGLGKRGAETVRAPQFRELPRVLRWIGRMIGAIFVVALLLGGPAVYFGYECRGTVAPDHGERAVAPLPPPIHAAIESTPGYRRPPERTYLAFPDWFVVYGSKDYAAFIAGNPPSRFPHWRAIEDVWSSTCALHREVTSRFQLDWRAQARIYGISVGTTLEHAIDGAYEATIGRLTEGIAPKPTDEDLFAARYAAAYAASLDTMPWYRFPFATWLKRLWTETSLMGEGAARKWERRLSLSTELGVKALLGAIIGAGKAATAAEPEEVFAVIARLPDTIPEIKTLTSFDDATALVALPRYAPFTEIVRKLTGTEARFLDIAGNRDIMITVIAPRGWGAPPAPARPVFQTDVLLDPDKKRLALSVPVEALLDTMRAISAAGGWVEHVYDY